MSTATAVETTHMPLINETAPDFTAETTEGVIRFHEWIGDGWQSCSRIRETSLRYAQPNWDTWPGFNPSSPGAIAKLSA